MDKTCQGCAFSQKIPVPHCSVFNVQVDLTKSACQFYRTKEDINTCESCSNKMVDGILFQTENGTKYICQECSSKSGTCGLCKQRVHCDFETNPSNTPKTVLKTIQKGPAIMQAEVRNPERINETCKNGCPCWDNKENYCLREIGTCRRYELCFG